MLLAAGLCSVLHHGCFIGLAQLCCLVFHLFFYRGKISPQLLLFFGRDLRVHDLAMDFGGVHALKGRIALLGEKVRHLKASGLEEVVVTDTIPLREEARKVAKIKVLSIAGLLGRTIENIHMETSVSSLFS